jgi:hypothetical protein
MYIFCIQQIDFHKNTFFKHQLLYFNMKHKLCGKTFTSPQNVVIFRIHCRKIKTDFKYYTFGQILWKLTKVSQFAAQLDTWSTGSVKLLSYTAGLYIGGRRGIGDFESFLTSTLGWLKWSDWPGEISRYSPNNRPVGIHSRYGRFTVKEEFLAVPGIDPRSFDFPGINLVKIPNEKMQLPTTS